MSAPYLATMAQRYSEQVLSSSIGKRVVHLDFWNHGLKKNMPQHYKVRLTILKVISISHCLMFVLCRITTLCGGRALSSTSTRCQIRQPLRRTRYFS